MNKIEDTKTITTTIDNAFNIPKRDKSQPKEIFTNKKTLKAYQAHPYFAVPQYYDNLITLQYRTNDASFKVPTTVSQKTLVSLHSAINELDGDKILAFIPDAEYALQRDQKPELQEVLDDDSGNVEYLVYATYTTQKRSRLGIAL